MLIAYTKNANMAEMLDHRPARRPGATSEDLVDYFPMPLRERFGRDDPGAPAAPRDRHDELVNQMVNLSGISFDHRMTEDTGASVIDVSAAWVAVRDVFDFPVWWEEIGDLTDIALDDQLELFLDCRRAAERCSLWMLRHRRPPVSIALEVDRFRGPVQELTTGLADCLRGALREAVDAMTARRIAQGVPGAARRPLAPCGG